MAATTETSNHTSRQKRIKEAQKSPTHTPAPYQPRTLMPFVGNPKQGMPQGLPFQLEDYLELLDWTGRILRGDKRGAIHQKLPPILSRLNIEPKKLDI